MKILLVSLAVLGHCASSTAQSVVSEYHWPELARRGEAFGGTVVDENGQAVLRIENSTNQIPHLEILRITDPPVRAAIYALTGQVRYEGVEGRGYLETWNHFASETPGMPDQQFFSRTLSDSGPMGVLTGSSGWREFSLPFNRTGTANAPVRIDFNVHLPGRGVVFLSSLRLVEYPNALTTGTWWSHRTAGWLFGSLGAGLGLLAAIMSVLADKGKGQPFVLGATRAMIGAGVVLGLLAIAALAAAQPPHVWSPLLLVSIVLIAVLTPRLGQFRRLYADAEMRRLAAIDATGA